MIWNDCERSRKSIHAGILLVFLVLTRSMVAHDFVFVTIFETYSTLTMGNASTSVETFISNYSSGTLSRRNETFDHLAIFQALHAPIHSIPGLKVTHLRNNSSTTCNSTIVTQFFPLANHQAKYSANKYQRWIHMFMTLQDCMIIYTTSAKEDYFMEQRKKHDAHTVIVTLPTVDSLPLARLGDTFWSQQHLQDIEKEAHKSYKLFWIWLSKSWLVQQAIQEKWLERHQTDSMCYAYIDIGCFRPKQTFGPVTHYLNQHLIRHPEIIPPERLVFLSHKTGDPQPPPSPVWDDKLRQHPYFYHSGAQAAGFQDAWLLYHEIFSDMAAQFVEGGKFVGDDQVVLQGACQANPHRCAYLRAGNLASRDNFYYGLRYVLFYGYDWPDWNATQESPRPFTWWFPPSNTSI